MTGWSQKRFWKEATAGEGEGGFTILLDGRAVRTPRKALLAIPTRALARAIAAEWSAQDGPVRPDTMPFTRLANSAIDTVTDHFAEVATIVAAFGETDHLCYRATGPDELCRRQATAWDPILDWADTALGARLRVTPGVMPVEQDAAALGRLRSAVDSHSPFELTALHEIVNLSGSLVGGLAVSAGAFGAADLWERAQVDDLWQVEHWGRDDEAEEARDRKKQAFAEAAEFLQLVRARL